MNVMLIVTLVFLVQRTFAAMDPVDMAEFLEYAGASGTQHGKSSDDPDYYESNSGIPLLPTLHGFMGTHGTYRFMSIHEQTAVVVGDGKHGLWRIQENGFIREYRKRGREGIPPHVDPNNLTSIGNWVEKVIYSAHIVEDYSHYLPEESWTGYKYPNDRISNGADGIVGNLNFIDLPIYHPKYKGKYDGHVPIDLPQFFCTVTRDDYEHMRNTWKFATGQPLANKIGPLGKRAGLDIKELYFNVLKFDFFADAGVWANIGIGDETTDRIVKTVDELKARYQTVNYQRVDNSKVDIEAYLFERPFFNVPYIFITFVMDNKVGPSEYSYARPYGPYWEGLISRNLTAGISTVPNHFPPAYVENYPVTGVSSKRTCYGLPLYGQHHPNRHAHGLTGGACPNRGGDWATYPWGNGGSGFPTNYEEVTPMCDGFVIDMKIWMNLQEPTWNNPDLFLGNAGFEGEIIVNYTVDANIYGRYTDPYLLNATNPFEMDLTENGTIVQPGDLKPETVVFKMNFTRLGTYLTFNNVTLDAP